MGLATTASSHHALVFPQQLLRVVLLGAVGTHALCMALAPTATTRMTDDVLPGTMHDHFKAEYVTPAAVYLASEQAPTRCILTAGAGTFASANVTLTSGVHLGCDSETPEKIAARFAEITARAGEVVPKSGTEQGSNELSKRGVTR